MGFGNQIIYSTSICGCSSFVALVSSSVSLSYSFIYIYIEVLPQFIKEFTKFYYLTSFKIDTAYNFSAFPKTVNKHTKDKDKNEKYSSLKGEKFLFEFY